MGDLERYDKMIRNSTEKPTATELALRFLPRGTLQDQARFFYGFYSETLKGALGLVTRIRYWMKTEGLTAAEAEQAMRNLMEPDRSAEIDTSPKAIAALSGEVAKILKERRARERTERIKDRYPMGVTDEHRAAGEKLHDLVEGLGAMQ